jgi:MoaA/NifB/PqqE/SkfB family radical SAM enzyme
MPDLHNTALAIAYCPARPMNVADMERYLHLVDALSGLYSPSPVAFWVDDPLPNVAGHQALSAAVFENDRRPVDHLLMAGSLDSLDATSVNRLLDALGDMRGESCAALMVPGADNGPVPDLLVMPMTWACRLAEHHSVDLPIDAETQGINASLIAALADLGAGVVFVSGQSGVMAAAPQVYRVPREAHFIPSMGAVGSTGFSLGEHSARIGAAIGVLAGIPADARVAVYGAGVIGRSVVALLGDRVALVIDRNPDAHGGQLLGKPVVSPGELPAHLHEFSSVLITVVGREPEIRATLAEHLGRASARLPVVDLHGCVESATPETSLPLAVPVVSQSFAVPADMPRPARLASELTKTTTRTLTPRGVLYVGYPCNIKCRFCYYAHADAKEWHSIEECKRDASLYREEFGNTQVDITGGEPTIYPEIFDLLDHCDTIGLRPSLITNMQALRDEEKVKRFRDHGVYDFLCSIHGLGDVYNHITATRHGWENILQATANLNRNGVRWRTNCTTVNTNMRQLKDIARYAYENGARAINYISYNPFYDWATKIDIDFQARHSEIAPFLIEALDYCDEVGLEANVRYMPFCMLRGHENKSYNYSQLSYDHHEWDYASWYSDRTQNPSSKLPGWMARLIPDAEALHLYLGQRTKAVGFARPAVCRQCALGFICDGLTNQYARRFGTDECAPYVGPTVLDPTHFISTQLKVVDEPRNAPAAPRGTSAP